MDSTATVREVMDREYVGVSESDRVTETAELMLSEGSESVVVLRGSEPVGILTQRDCLAALVEDDGDSPVSDAMQTDVPTVSPAATIGEVADVLSSQGSGRVVVTEGDRTVGVLGERDLITTSPFGPDRGVATTGPDAPTTRPDADADGELAGLADERDAVAAAGGFENQSICEACGRLARDLSTFNGQLLCGDCRDI
jgi:CBS domain-containing protein